MNQNGRKGNAGERWKGISGKGRGSGEREEGHRIGSRWGRISRGGA